MVGFNGRSLESFELFSDFINRGIQTSVGFFGPKTNRYMNGEESIERFDRIYQALRREYMSYRYPFLSSYVVFFAASNGGQYYFHFWALLLYKYLAHPEEYGTDAAKREIADNVNIIIPLSVRDKRLYELVIYLTQIHTKYLIPDRKKEDTEKPIEQKIKESKEKKDGLKAIEDEAEQKKKELLEQVDKEVSEYREQQMKLVREQIDAEREQLLKQLKDDPKYQILLDDLKQENAQVAEMVRSRKEMETRLAQKMNETSKEFRDSTKDVTSKFTSILEDYLQKLSQETGETVRQLEMQTQNAINSVADVNRNLQNDDFSDLLHAYTRLEEQVYYKGREGRDATEEYREYWRNVEVYLKSFGRTLIKLGFTRFMPEIGAVLDAETMKAFENSDTRSGDSFPEDESEYGEYCVKEIVSSGFRDSAGEVEVRAIVIPVRKTEQKESDMA